MRVPPFERYQRLLAGFGIFLAGGIIGSAVYMSIHQQSYNLLYVKMHTYEEENQKLRLDMESLKKYKNHQSVVTQVNVYVQNREGDAPLTEDIRQELETRIKKDMKLIIGQKVAFVKDARHVFEQLISQKTYLLHEKTYTVEVKSIILVQTELSIWITAEIKRT